MARKNKNGLIIQQVRKISAEKWESKRDGNFYLILGWAGWPVQSEQRSSGCCHQMSTKIQQAEIQEAKKCLGWSGADPHPDFLS